MLDVAKRAKVSLSTVSYALNGKRSISEKTRQRIAAAMEELQYQPNSLARGLASKRSRILAIVFPGIERVLGITDLEYITAAAKTANAQGYHLVFWLGDTDSVSEIRQLTKQGLVEGVILMEIHTHDERVELLHELKFPFSMIGRRDDRYESKDQSKDQDSQEKYVDTDFKRAMDESLAYLVGLGHRTIGFINQSLAAYQARHGPTIRTQHAFEEHIALHQLRGIARFCDELPQAGYEAVNAMLEECPDLTAIVIRNERAIPGILRAIAERGWKIPEDFSLILAVCSLRMAETISPKLTVVEAPSAELGRLATEMLIKQLEDKGNDDTKMLLPCRLIVGDSTGPCRRNPKGEL